MDNLKRQQKLKGQIELRIELLNKKVSGELDDIVIPNSLTKLRLWSEEQYGIETIGSPSSFVTTHPEHGNKIRLLQKLLGQLRKPKKTKQKPASKKLSEVVKENKRLLNLLQNTANQYVQHSHELRRLRENTVLSQSIEKGLREALKEANADLTQAKSEISRLRSQLLKSENTRSAKVTKVDFGKDD